MCSRVENIIESSFRWKENEGESKVTSLKEAIERNVKPGMKLHTLASATAALFEIVRQYWATRPEFFLYVPGMATGPLMSLVHCGLVKNFIISNCSHAYPRPGPDRTIHRALQAGTIEIQNWSMCSLEQRLLAGAQGVPFLPTKSIVGSDMEKENADSFQVVDDPFGSGKKVGLTKAFVPDISLIHAWAADPYGNTLVPASFSADGLWGPRASKNGAIVTVEKIVSTDFIRQHSSFAKVPGYVVNSVVLAPLGAHPFGVANHGMREIEEYGVDGDFLVDYRRATEDSRTLDAWIREWILDCATHEDYVHKLGYERIQSLKRGIVKDAWKHDLESAVRGLDGKEYNFTEMMIVTAARKMKERILESGYRILHCGIGAAGLAAEMAYLQLRQDDYGLDLTTGGIVGYLPQPFDDPSVYRKSKVETAKLLTDTVDGYSIILGGENNKCLSALGAGQIDKFGNINSSRTSRGFFLTGAGGANDVANSAKELIVVAAQARGRFVDKVPYVSAPGTRVRTLISDLGVFEKRDDDKEFILTGYFPNPEVATAGEKIRRVKENCGWELKVADDIKEVRPPTFEELVILRSLDPKRVYLGG